MWKTLGGFWALIGPFTHILPSKGGWNPLRCSGAVLIQEALKKSRFATIDLQKHVKNSSRVHEFISCL